METIVWGRRALLAVLAAAVTAGWVAGATAQMRTFSFAYDQPNTTAYGIAASIIRVISIASSVEFSEATVTVVRAGLLVGKYFAYSSL